MSHWMELSSGFVVLAALVFLTCGGPDYDVKCDGPKDCAIGDHCVSDSTGTWCEPLNGCQTDCEGRNCGGDNCLGICGLCEAGYLCGQGVCEPESTFTKTCQDYGYECGEWGGEICGTCSAGKKCLGGECVCSPSCTDKQCGSDGCGGSCGTCMPPASCAGDGKCVCTPDCTGKQCGDNGCGNSCGSCSENEVCNNGICASTVPTTGSCKWYFSCAGDCPPQPQGQACLQECQAGLSPTGQQDVESLFNCLEVNNCQDKPTDGEWSQCLEDFCLNPYFVCFSGKVYATCPDMIGCINNCPEDNPATSDVNEQQICIGNCWSDSTVEVQWSLQNLIDCMYDNCTTCNDAWEATPCQDCLNTVLGEGGKCEALNNACMSYGTWDCGQVFECVMACTDNACAQDCFNNATKTAGDKYNDMIDCALDTCPECKTTPPGDSCDACFNAALNDGGTCFGKTQTCVNGV